MGNSSIKREKQIISNENKIDEQFYKDKVEILKYNLSLRIKTPLIWSLHPITS